MKIIEDVRQLVQSRNFQTKQALRLGLEQKAKEFAEKGSEVYTKA